MKKSEQLKLDAQEEENDIKSFGIMCKSLREQRFEKFDEVFLTRLKEKYTVENDGSSKFTIYTKDFGILDYFPKANKILIRKENRWKKPGLKWIVNNLLINPKKVSWSKEEVEELLFTAVARGFDTALNPTDVLLTDSSQMITDIWGNLIKEKL